MESSCAGGRELPPNCRFSFYKEKGTLLCLERLEGHEFIYFWSTDSPSVRVLASARVARSAMSWMLWHALSNRNIHWNMTYSSPRVWPDHAPPVGGGADPPGAKCSYSKPGTLSDSLRFRPSHSATLFRGREGQGTESASAVSVLAWSVLRPSCFAATRSTQSRS